MSYDNLSQETKALIRAVLGPSVEQQATRTPQAITRHNAKPALEERLAAIEERLARLER